MRTIICDASAVAYSDWVGCVTAHDMHICEVPGLGVVLEVSCSDHGYLTAQIQLLAEVGAPLHTPLSPQT